MEFFNIYNSPIGTITIYSDGKSITHVSFSNKIPQTKNTCTVIEEAIKQLEEYFNGKRFNFNLPLAPEGTVFQKEVWEELKKIPFGQTTSYKDISIKTGDKNNVRAVGTANGKNPIAIIIPCHRVIGTNGKLTGYAGGIWRKKWLLNHEREISPSKNTLF